MEGLGWGVIPIWVGLQPSCAVQNVPHRFTASPAQDGVNDATAAKDAALGFGGLAGTIIYVDIEQYNGSPANPSCSSDVQKYINSWVATMHQFGFLAGVYFSTSNWSDFQASANVTNVPDAVFAAEWVSSNPFSSTAYNYVLSVYGLAPMPDTVWTGSGQRTHQFLANVPTDKSANGGNNPYSSWFNGMAVNPPNGIDIDVENAYVAPWTTPFRALPAPQIVSPTNGATNQPVDVNLNVKGVDAQVSGYHILVSTDPSAIPTTPNSGCLTYCQVDIITNGTLLPFQWTPGVTFYWTVRAVGLYKPGNWAPRSNFTVASGGGL
jgi:hypothetical protein